MGGRPPPPQVQQAYDALAKFDEELDNVDEELRKATARVTFQFEKQRQAIYKRRAEVARSIPQFWPIAVRGKTRGRGSWGKRWPRALAVAAHLT